MFLAGDYLESSATVKQERERKEKWTRTFLTPHLRRDAPPLPSRAPGLPRQTIFPSLSGAPFRSLRFVGHASLPSSPPLPRSPSFDHRPIASLRLSPRPSLAPPHIRTRLPVLGGASRSPDGFPRAPFPYPLPYSCVLRRSLRRPDPTRHHLYFSRPWAHQPICSPTFARPLASKR